jgi:subtilisin family serine protease
MKKRFKSLLWLLLPATIILSIGCAKTKDPTSDEGLNTTARTVTFSGDYYWHEGKRVPLFKNNNKKYILINPVDESNIVSALQKKNIKIADAAKSFVIPASIQKKDTKGQDGLKWLIVESNEHLSKSNPEILYEAPFFSFAINEEDYGLSHLFYVKLKNEKDISKLEEMSALNKVQILGNNIYRPLWHTLACGPESAGNALEMANTFYETGNFSACQPDLMVPIKTNCVNDPYFNSQWNLSNSGQYGGTAGIDIGFCNARSITQGSNSITVAVIDHGIELTHPDLNISPNSYDTETATSPSIVRGNHGTACAGIIGAQANNGIGVAGIAPDCPLMSISNNLVSSPGTAERLATGFDYARTHGAAVISNSWYYPYTNQVLQDAIIDALTLGRGGLGCIVVFASGNFNSSVSYPANFHPNIVVVGAISPCGQRKSPSSCDGESWGSNYGNSLDIVAPGVLIPTTDITGTGGYNPNVPIHPSNGGTKIFTDFPNQSYTVWFNGTSSAAPHVAGVAALILSVNPNLTQQQVANIIEQTAQKVGGYSYTTTTGRPNGTWHNEMGYGLLNAFAAVTAANCATVYYNNQTVNTNTTIAGCSIESTNVTVNSGAKLTFTALNYILLNADFEVKSGAEFEAGF